MEEQKKVRVDKYLWSIRLFKTRSLATVACDKGRVKCLENDVKASRTVKIGDVYEVKTDDRKWIIKIVSIIEKRVAYAEAITHYLDLTPQEEKDKTKFVSSSFYTGKRLSKVGRPAKVQRRDIDNFLKDE